MVTKDQIRKAVNLLVEKYHPIKIILFGSYALGTPTNDSDVDLFIIKEDVPPIGRERIREIRRNFKLNFACDIFVYKPEELKERIKLKDPFIQAVLKTGQVLYG